MHNINLVTVVYKAKIDVKMTKVSDRFLSFRVQMAYLFGVSGFFIGFIFLYRPLQMVEFFDMGRGIMAFNTTMLFCILFGVLLISRMLLYSLRRRFEPSWFGYSLWIMGEILVASLFMSLYLTLMYRGEYPYFDVVGISLFINIIVLSIPYVITSLSVVVSEIANTEEPSEGSLVRFHDNTQKLKLVVSSDAVMYVKAEENYVRIKYLENETIKDYVLRNTMKSLEPLLQKYGMVRCQRSFFVNPKHVKVLRKDKQGVVVAELNASGADTIPVSPKYYDTLEKML